MQAQEAAGDGDYYTVRLRARQRLSVALPATDIPPHPRPSDQRKKPVAIVHTSWYVCIVKPYDWSDEKNEWLRRERGITFEDVVFHLAHDGPLDTIEHPNQRQYPGQRVFIVNVEGCACLVPFAEDEEGIFLKTIIPSRKMTKQYLGGD